MGKGKLKKFAELETFYNTYQKPDGALFKGNWKNIFWNNNPIVLELACGKGHYTNELAKRYPNKNFIGVDIKGNRLHVGAREAIADNLHNVRFLRIFIDNLDEYFAKGEVDEIWITFPDPYLKDGKANKRLTSPKFLEIYSKVVKKDGIIQLKTDSPELFAFTLETLEEHNIKPKSLIKDVYKEQHDNNLLTDIQTYYEKMHLKDGRTIRYVSFSLNK